MELTWYGHSCFRLTERGCTTIVTDPYKGNIGLAEPSLKGDVVTVSHAAPGHSNSAGVSGHLHVLSGPGEYEIGGVFITGVATPHHKEPNVLYVFDYNGLNIAHLGDIAKVPTQSQIEALGQVDILLVPVGGGNSLNAVQAAEIVSMLEPSYVIPMHYDLPNLKIKLDPVERFLKEMGATESEEAASLKITPSKLPDETQTIVLRPKI